MRIVIFCLLSCFIFSCRSQKRISICKPLPISLASLREKYKIIKIDSTDKIYLIYARKDSMAFKIPSLKDAGFCAEPIKVGGEYPLVLFGQDYYRAPHITGTDFHGADFQYEKEWGNNMFIAVNLKGLCLKF